MLSLVPLLSLADARLRPAMMAVGCVTISPETAPPFPVAALSATTGGESVLLSTTVGLLTGTSFRAFDTTNP